MTWLISFAIAIASPAGEAPRPPPLAAQAECELWRGVADSNDSSVQIDLRLCGQGRLITGVLQWSSPQSGHNVRDLVGARSTDGALILRDLRVRDERPMPGWRFCAIDRYDLAPVSPTRMEGTYTSLACSDQATLSLDRVPR